MSEKEMTLVEAAQTAIAMLSTSRSVMRRSGTLERVECEGGCNCDRCATRRILRAALARESEKKVETRWVLGIKNYDRWNYVVMKDEEDMKWEYDKALRPNEFAVRMVRQDEIIISERTKEDNDANALLG